jgi:CHASE2 domain-containing sensor protein
MKKLNVLIVITVIVTCSCNSQTVNESIVIINTGDYDKGRIAEELAIINRFEPKVVSIDIAFPEYSGDIEDQNLILSLEAAKKLVLPSEISSLGNDYYGNEMILVSLTCSAEFFPLRAKSGFVSMKMEESEIPNSIPKQFIVWQKSSASDDIYHHFSVVTAMAVDSLKAVDFVQKNERLVDVDFKKGRRMFRTFSQEEVLSGKVKKEDIKGKIILMGFLGPGSQDKFISPFNTNPEEPDMYGVEYLANIVAQVLEFNR